MFLGTLLANDGRTVIRENYYAGRLKLIISHNIVKTNMGVYHLIGKISQGYPNNLYRACLEANGIPKTWKYILTQFSGKRPAYTQPTTSRLSNHEIEIIGRGTLELIKSYRLLRHFATIADRRTREHNKAHKSISFVRHLFHQKLVKSLKIVNDQIILVRFNVLVIRLNIQSIICMYKFNKYVGVLILDNSKYNQHNNIQVT